MKPKEKAEELFTHYHNLIQEIGGELGQEILVSILAKQCALFVVREIMRVNMDLQTIESYDEYCYWEKVQYMIEDLY
jgi:hypothetical protein